MIISDDGADLPIPEQEYDKYDDEPFNDSPEPDPLDPPEDLNYAQYTGRADWEPYGEEPF